jgi:hypothetical protein
MMKPHFSQCGMDNFVKFLVNEEATSDNGVRLSGGGNLLFPELKTSFGNGREILEAATPHGRWRWRMITLVATPVKYKRG